MQRIGKKLFAILMVVCMLVGLMPLHASAITLEGEDYITQQLYLGEDIVLHLRGNIPEEYRKGATGTLEYAGVTESFSIEEMTPDENGLYDLPITLSPAQLTDEIHLVLNAKVGIISGTIDETYTVRDYLKTLIDGNYTRETKALAKELLNYGTAAQKYFEHNTDNLANSGGYEISAPTYAVPEQSPAAVADGTVPGIIFYGTTLRFLSETAVRFYFQTEGNIADYTITVGGEQVTPVSKGSDNLYYVEIGGLNPQDMGTEITVNVSNGTKSFNASYTPINYLIRQYNKTEDETFKNLMAAAYSYFIAAKDFAGVTDTEKLIFTAAAGSSNAVTVTTNMPADSALDSFSLTDSCCNVNQSANPYQTATNVVMSKNGDEVLMTFNFAGNFQAGQYYTLPKNAFFSFSDDSQYSVGQDYIFLYDGTTWSIVEKSGDFTLGVNFEKLGNTLLFSGNGPKAATVTRVSYADDGIEALSFGGDYALMINRIDANNPENNRFPNFVIDFGKELAAGTKITFMAYGKINGSSNNNQSVFEYTNGGDATAQFTCDQWTQLTITLTEATDSVELFWNFDRAGGLADDATGQVYVDNFVAVEPVEATGDFLTGINFEEAGHAGYFVGQGITERDANLVRVAYENEGVAAPANGGSYALKVSHTNNSWPTFRVNFGTTLKSGTTITFDVYGNYDYEAAEGVNKYIKLELTEDSKKVAESADPNQVVWTLVETWKTGVTITLTADTDHLDFFYNVADGNHGAVASWILLDNFKAEEVLVFTGDFETGVGLEDAGDILQFTGIGNYKDATTERVAYADTGVSAPANGGSYALKVSHANNCWPDFRINFGKTLEAGTVITFDVYGNYDYETTGTKYIKLELAADSKNYATSEDPNQVLWTVVGTWRTGVAITLTADTDHVDFFYNVADGQHGDVSSWLLLDNFKAEKHLVFTGDFETGVGLEDAGDILQFTGLTSDINIERVSYADTGVSAPANGGSYALKVSHANNCWPNFRVNFGKTLTAGTVITFDVYGNYDYEAAEGVNKYVKLELTGDSKNYATSADSNQVVWTLVETWRTGVAITLTADSDHVDFFYNVADGQHGDVSSWLLMDNFKAEVPLVFTGDFVTGVGLEDAGDILQFTGLTSDINIERVSYTDTGVSAPANGGSYALKVSHANNCWPNFRVNFGKTLKAGTVITFDVYGNYDYVAAEGVNKYVKLELTSDSKNYATSADPNQVVWTLVETWRTGVTITLTADSDHVDFFYNVADGQHGDVASWLLMDNFKAEEPFTAGADFENANDSRFFVGIGGTKDATIERVSYANENVTAPANGGSYALKVSHESNCWPDFRINFGQTLKAGTVITFDVYGNYDYVAAEGVNKYVKLELAADSKNYATSEDPNQVLWTLVETWRTGVTITLTADSDHVDFFYNVADGQHGDVPSWLLLDNVKVVEPA